MPELLRLQSTQFELSIWCNDIAKRQKTHQTTIKKRSPDVEFEHYDRQALIRFEPPFSLNEVTVMGKKLTVPESASNHLMFAEPFFFENMQYQFEWIFFEKVEEAWLTHRSHALNEGFRFAKSTHTSKRALPARLTGTINTGNNVGWMRLPLSFKVAEQEYHSQIAFEVLPTKIDLHKDLPAMYHTIDETFPLWRFSLVEKTEQDAAKSKHRGHFPLLWLAYFGDLRKRFEAGLKVIAQAPHSRLQPKVSYTKANRFKGRFPHRLAAKVKEDLANNLHDKHYRIEKKYLSVDTPENRFIKMVVTQCKKRLTDFEIKLRKNNQIPDNQRLSDAFLVKLHSWQQPLYKMQRQSFLKEVGTFHGLANDSLVLQQKTGYSTIYRVWQELKFYLDVLANQSSVSMKSIDKIYEVWCFLELRNILINELGFIDNTPKQRSLELNDYFECQLKDGFAGAFKFERKDGVQAKLVHEPKFTKKSNNIRSYLVSQEPDIVLEVRLPKPIAKRFVWLFDAKYRIKTKKSRFDNDNNINSIDYVPDDAINQMHRYRDALIRITEDQSSLTGSKSRPVFGAFALYPGYFDQENTENIYDNAIDEIGIGAFALLPSSDGKAGRYWLTNFLHNQIGAAPKQEALYNIKSIQEQLYVQEAARIPYYGMKQVLYPDLTMTVALAGQRGRYSTYFSAFEENTAKCYHLPQKTFLNKYKRHIVKEIRFLALASTSEQNSHRKQIDKLWPVKNVTLIPRCRITEKQAGKVSDSKEFYYLFDLGNPLMLKNAICSVPHRPIRNSMKLTTLALMENVQTFCEVEKVYQDALV